jgi:hypothetical protein
MKRATPPCSSIQSAVYNAEAEAPAKKGSPRITTDDGYVQLPGTGKALLVENCAADRDEALNFWCTSTYILRLKSEHANQKGSSACCFSNPSDN